MRPTNLAWIRLAVAARDVRTIIQGTARAASRAEGAPTVPAIQESRLVPVRIHPFVHMIHESRRLDALFWQGRRILSSFYGAREGTADLPATLAFPVAAVAP